ncbi:MAG: WYL domain-containing protein [Ktedonobacteraceae bacterium]|nr:WYL domain-containing protein [Ktedonobacteraceae bacterium]
MNNDHDPISAHSTYTDDDDIDSDVPSTGGLKNEAAERIFHLLQFLMANECTRKDVFEQLAFYYKIDLAAPMEQRHSRRAGRMFERDIKFLEDQGFEIKKIKARGQIARYSLIKGSGPQTAFLFTQAEVDSLALLYNLFADPTQYAQIDPTQPLPQQPTRNPFAEEMVALIDRLVTTLPIEQKKNFTRWVRKPYVYFNITPVTDYLPHRATIDAIVHAISARQQIQFGYTATQRQNPTFHEHIDPYYIIYLEGHFYLIAYSHKVSQFLEYRVDRIQGDTLKMQPDMIDVERRRHPVEFRFWIDSNLTKHSLSQRWLTHTLEREEVDLDEHGRERRRVLVRATAYSEWRIIQQILKYGDKAEIVEPLHLREKMKETVKRMHHFYE